MNSIIHIPKAKSVNPVNNLMAPLYLFLHLSNLFVDVPVTTANSINARGSTNIRLYKRSHNTFVACTIIAIFHFFC